MRGDECIAMSSTPVHRLCLLCKPEPFFKSCSLPLQVLDPVRVKRPGWSRDELRGPNSSFPAGPNQQWCVTHLFHDTVHENRHTNVVSLFMTPLWLEFFFFFFNASFSIQPSNCFNLDDLKVDEFGEPFGTFGCFNLNGQGRGSSRALESLCSQEVCLWYMRCGCLGWLGSHGEGHGKPLQYSCLENPMDRGA